MPLKIVSFAVFLSRLSFQTHIIYALRALTAFFSLLLLLLSSLECERFFFFATAFAIFCPHFGANINIFNRLWCDDVWCILASEKSYLNKLETHEKKGAECAVQMIGSLLIKAKISNKYFRLVNFFLSAALCYFIDAYLDSFFYDFIRPDANFCLFVILIQSIHIHFVVRRISILKNNLYYDRYFMH